MRKKKRKLRISDVDFALFEVMMHEYLDLLGAPEGDYLGMRLRQHLQAIGKLPPDVIRNTDALVQKCASCQTEYSTGTVCPKCYG